MCQGIELYDLPIDDEAFSRVISENRRASHLQFIKCPLVTSLGFRQIDKLQCVQDVWISHPQFGDQDCTHIPTNRLQSCALINCAVTDAGVKTLCEASPLLSALDLSGCEINGDCFAGISAPKLSVLNCVNCRSLQDTSLCLLRDFAPKLQELKISLITEAGLDAICRLDDLHSLTIVESPLQERQVLRIAQSMERLEVLRANVTCDNVEALHQKVRTINRRLHLSTQIRNEHFAEYFPGD